MAWREHHGFTRVVAASYPLLGLVLCCLIRDVAFQFLYPLSLGSCSHRNQLRDNPVPKLSAPRAKPPRIEPDTDWALVPVGKDGGICINLFTAEGRDRWALADLWRPAPAPQQ